MNKINVTLLQINSRKSFSLQSTIIKLNKNGTTHDGLIQHTSAKHHEHHRRITLRTNNPAQQRSQPLIPEYDEVLWNTPITMIGPSASRASAL